jgi:hypothetical protein
MPSAAREHHPRTAHGTDLPIGVCRGLRCAIDRERLFGDRHWSQLTGARIRHLAPEPLNQDCSAGPFWTAIDRHLAESWGTGRCTGAGQEWTA